MKNSKRLAKLESKKHKVNYPSFADIYQTQTKANYQKWLLLNNPCLNQFDIDRLNIKTLEDFYE